jgi:quinol monooxygenase YgiN
MSDDIFYVFEVAIKEGRLEDFKAVMNDMVKATKGQEPGTTHYEWFISADSATCHIYERYANSKALVAHLKTVREKFSKALWATVEARRLTIYGSPDDEVREAFAGSGAIFMAPIGGFVRK